MSNHGMASSAASPNDASATRRLELSLNPADGSLLTSTLTQVLLASTGALYSDLYDMAHGELDVITTSAQESDNPQQQQQQQQQEEENAVAQQQTKRERMSNLSFAQRRHELAWRMAQHSRGLQHVSALTAASASSDLSHAVAVSSKALQHARTAWVQADEAQDALYFFHAQLFHARASPHDVYGALDLQLLGQWFDLPKDMRLSVDRYETSGESEWSRQEVEERWHMVVRDKLLCGEVGWMRRRQNIFERLQLQQSSPASKPPGVLWKVSLRGGIIRLTHGTPKTIVSHQTTGDSDNNGNKCYPIECLLTVLSGQQAPEWSLLSLEVRVQAKTGEFNHQLETSNRQRYDLHRLAAMAMSREEARARREKAESATGKTAGDDSDSDSDDDTSVTSSNAGLMARPLEALFQVAHTFSLSWQLEVLSAQAQALRRGVWAAGRSNHIQVTPVRFVDPSTTATSNTTSEDDETSNAAATVLGVVSISFWKVDGSYGPPSMGDLNLSSLGREHDHTPSAAATLALAQQNASLAQQQLVLSIRAEANVGIRVSLSGASSVMPLLRTQPHLHATARELIEAASNPFALSASDALLAATRLCAERKCHAVVHALQPCADRDGVTSQTILPSWMLLTVERGSIAVAARINYHGAKDDDVEVSKYGRGFPILFRLLCDARTGSFVNSFPRCAHLLRRLACNDWTASESMSLRIAMLPQNRRRAAGASTSGRAVRDAFDGLVRSMNVLGQRTGVGGTWDNLDGEKSAKLRERAIQSACSDVRVSLIRCCGMAAMYGMAPLAIGGALGLDAVQDMAGEAVPPTDGNTFVAAPPVSIILHQELIESTTSTSDGVTKRLMYTEQSLFAVTCAVDENSVTLFPLDITVKLDSPTAVAQRKSCSLMQFEKSQPVKGEEHTNGDDGVPAKRRKLQENGGSSEAPWAEDIMVEVGRFADLLTGTLDFLTAPNVS